MGLDQDVYLWHRSFVAPVHSIVMILLASVGMMEAKRANKPATLSCFTPFRDDCRSGTGAVGKNESSEACADAL